MPDFPLAHINWSVADNSTRKACDAFLREIFAAQTAFEMVMTPETEPLGYDREETLLLVGDTMLIPIAPVGPGERPDSDMGEFLRAHARPGQWLGIAITVADLDAAHGWVLERGCSPVTPAGAEGHCFLLDRNDAMGVILEFLATDLPGDPRTQPGWRPEWWREDHPLGIEGLQSIGVSTASLDAARAVFADKFGWPELSRRHLAQDHADCAAFRLGDNVIEAMYAADMHTPLGRHAVEIGGIYCITFQVRSAAAAAAYLRGKGLDLIGEQASRFAIDPAQAFDRLIYFTDLPLEGRPPFQCKLLQPARLS